MAQDHLRVVSAQKRPGSAKFKAVGAVSNAISILRALAHHARPMGVAEVSRVTGVGVSTCFNILRTLAHERLVSFDAQAKTYAIGLGVLEFSLPVLGAGQGDIIRPELVSLSGAHATLICLWRIVNGDRIVLSDKVFDDRTVRVELPPGARLPAFAGAVGRCYAAHRDLDGAALRAAFDQVRWQAPPSFDKYRREVGAARDNGVGFDFSELFVGINSVAALIVDGSGGAPLAISSVMIAGVKSPAEMQALATDVRDTARRIGGLLFGAVAPAEGAGLSPDEGARGAVVAAPLRAAGA